MYVNGVKPCDVDSVVSEDKVKVLMGNGFLKIYLDHSHPYSYIWVTTTTIETNKQLSPCSRTTLLLSGSSLMFNIIYRYV